MWKTTRLAGSLLLALLVPLQSALADEADRLALSRSSALDWLALIDGGDINASWSEASSLFKQAVSADDWDRAISGARGPLGDLSERAFVGASHHTSLPGAPDGEYVVMQFRATFARKANAVETVTTMLEADITISVDESSLAAE